MAGRAPALILAAVLALPVAVAGETEPTRFVVGFDGPRDLRPGDRFAGGEVVRSNAALATAVVLAADPASFRSKAEQEPGVRWVEQDAHVRAALLVPNDPYYDDQYGPQQVRAPAAWDETLGDTAKNVCVVDTGVRRTHEEFAGRWKGGIDYANADSDPSDDNGHGTHVAGTAAAGLNNGKGVAGLANVGVLGVKALDATGSGWISDIAEGIQWCADNGGHVISLSLGWSGDYVSARNAVQYAWNKGALLVAAAGNDGPCSDCISYPAKYAEVIAVTCTTATESQCSFSSDGPESELAAPGYDVLSTYHLTDVSYAYMSGTSMSTPHVSGVAALVWSRHPSLTNADLRQALRDTARDAGASGWDEAYGHGIVDAQAAIGSVSPPLADAGPDVSASDADGDGSAVVRLDGSGSSAGSSAIVAWDWLENGALLASGEIVDVALAVGAHTVTLRVTDSAGRTDTDETVATVAANAAPTAAFTVSCLSLVCDFDGTGSTDPDGGALTYAWDFGDGATGSGATVRHEYAAEGLYSVSLRVVDAGGLEDSTTATVDASRYRALVLHFHGGASNALGASAPFLVRGTMDETTGSRPHSMPAGGYYASLPSLLARSPEAYPAVFRTATLAADVALRNGTTTVADGGGSPWTVSVSAKVRVCLHRGSGGPVDATVYELRDGVAVPVLVSQGRVLAAPSPFQPACTSVPLAYADPAAEGHTFRQGSRIVVALAPDASPAGLLTSFLWDGVDIQDSRLDLTVRSDG